MSDQTRGGRHPDDATLAAWIDGNLTPREEQIVREHLDRCATCLEIVSETAAALEESEDDESSAETDSTPFTTAIEDGPSRPWIWLATAALIILAVASAVLLSKRGEPTLASPDQRLASVIPNERELEVRLAGLDWRPLERELRGGTDEHSFELLAEVARIREQAEAEPSQENLHSLATAYLILGDAGRALEVFERAEASGPLSMSARSDYAAALLANGSRSEDPRPCGEALDVIATIEAGPELAGTLAFNRALALECTGLIEPAMEAWSDYLEIDPSSEWSTEAREHLDRLEKELRIDREEGADDLVDRVNDEILPDWGEAVLAGDAARAASSLASARRIADETGEGVLLETVRLLERDGSDAAANAHILYGLARKAYEGVRISEAESLADRAADELRRMGSPFFGFAQLLSASCAYYRNDLPATSTRIESIAIDSSSPILQARVHWMRGIVVTSREERQNAAREYDRARKAFAEAGAPSSASTMAIYLAESLLGLGRAEDAWQLLAGVAPSAHLLPPLRQYQLYEVMATAASASDLRILASDVTHVALQAAKKSGRPDVIAGALALPFVHERNTALLDELATAVSAISDDGVRSRTSTVFDVWIARAMAEKDPERAEHAASRALMSLTAPGNEFLRGDAHLYRGIARARLGKTDASTEDLAEAIRIMSARTYAAKSEIDRVLARDVQFRAWSEWISLLWSSDRRLEALQRVLEARNAAPFASTGTDQREAVRLVLWPSARRTFAWIESDRGETRTFEIPLGQKRVMAIIRRMERTQRSDPLDSLLEPFSPIAKALAEENAPTVLILATPPFDQLPWAAVPTGRGPLIAVSAVSLTLGKTGSPQGCRQRHLVAALGSGAAVGELSFLPYVDDELSMVRDLYGSTDRSGSNCGVLHYAGHATSAGLRSELYLAGESVTPVQLHDQLPHDVAVLSACRTAGGRATKLSGTLSHARELLANGTSEVMATLWPVADGESLEMLEMLHGQLRDGAPAIDALAGAQRASIAKGSDSRSWSTWIHLSG